LFADQDHDPRYDQCLKLKATAKGNGCIYGDVNVSPTLALWGDSHAAVYSAMLGDLAAARDQSLLAFTMPACPPLNGWALEQQSWRESCLAFQRRTMTRLLETPSIRTVLLSGRFAGYPIDEPSSGFESTLRQTIETLRHAGKQVLVIYPVPELGENIPVVLARALEGGELVQALSQPVSEFRDNFFTVLSFLDAMVASEGIGAIKPSEGLCDQDQCFFYRDGIVFYYDEHHLSLSGAARLRPLFENVF
jgi:hypothetical protein